MKNDIDITLKESDVEVKAFYTVEDGQMDRIVFYNPDLGTYGGFPIMDLDNATTKKKYDNLDKDISKLTDEDVLFNFLTEIKEGETITFDKKEYGLSNDLIITCDVID
ncbi:hypothetical protein [Methanobrevibacter sp. DSM 116169]|uniref:hypothetical protein n=1 Tax=Methanobrevibacter sp. DSM 116169 TaxID=3242727 RepID=UPI0038FCE221